LSERERERKSGEESNASSFGAAEGMRDSTRSRRWRQSKLSMGWIGGGRGGRGGRKEVVWRWEEEERAGEWEVARVARGWMWAGSETRRGEGMRGGETGRLFEREQEQTGGNNDGEFGKGWRKRRAGSMSILVLCPAPWDGSERLRLKADLHGGVNQYSAGKGGEKGKHTAASAPPSPRPPASRTMAQACKARFCCRCFELSSPLFLLLLLERASSSTRSEDFPLLPSPSSASEMSGDGRESDGGTWTATVTARKRVASRRGEEDCGEGKGQYEGDWGEGEDRTQITAEKKGGKGRKGREGQTEGEEREERRTRCDGLLTTTPSTAAIPRSSVPHISTVPVSSSHGFGVESWKEEVRAEKKTREKRKKRM
jgi:hypothetical protein